MAEEHNYEFNVKMTCSGCSGAVSRVLTKLEAEGLVSKYDVNLEAQSVKVRGTIEYDDLENKIRNTGKTVNWGKVAPAAPEVPDEVDPAEVDPEEEIPEAVAV